MVTGLLRSRPFLQALYSNMSCAAAATHILLELAAQLFRYLGLLSETFTPTQTLKML